MWCRSTITFSAAGFAIACGTIVHTAVASSIPARILRTRCMVASHRPRTAIGAHAVRCVHPSEVMDPRKKRESLQHGADAVPVRQAEPDEERLAGQVLFRDEAPEAAVGAVVAIVAHREVITLRHLPFAAAIGQQRSTRTQAVVGFDVTEAQG